LGAGWAAIEAFREIGIDGLRLRWPNDILVGRRKLAGLLVEQYQPETAVIGVGINVGNRPVSVDRSLNGLTVSIQELSTRPVSTNEVTPLVLKAFRRLQAMIEQDRFPEIVADINNRWGEPRRVELSLNGQPSPKAGFFRSVDENGRLNFTDDAGQSLVLEASQVALLREL
jgi:BirA family biotin operon repressor/biotin-[acetyl-CoA-carboxylase] ligase